MSQPPTYYVALYLGSINGIPPDHDPSMGTTDPAPTGDFKNVIGSYEVNTSATVRALANSGWLFDKWILDDGTISYQNPFTIYMDRNKGVDLYFKQSGTPPGNATVNILVNGQGSTNPSVGVHTEFLLGTTLYVSATPVNGWHYLKMKRNGFDHTTANPGEFLNLAETETIEVIFEQNTQPPPNGGGFPVMLAIPIAGIITVGLLWWVLKK